MKKDASPEIMRYKSLVTFTYL